MNFKWIVMLSNSIWNSHPLCATLWHNLSQRVCAFHVEVSSRLIHLILILPVWKIYNKLLTGGVCIFNALAQCSRDVFVWVWIGSQPIAIRVNFIKFWILKEESTSVFCMNEKWFHPSTLVRVGFLFVKLQTFWLGAKLFNQCKRWKHC